MMNGGVYWGFCNAYVSIILVDFCATGCMGVNSACEIGVLLTFFPGLERKLSLVIFIQVHARICRHIVGFGGGWWVVALLQLIWVGYAIGAHAYQVVVDCGLHDWKLICCGVVLVVLVHECPLVGACVWPRISTALMVGSCGHHVVVGCMV